MTNKITGILRGTGTVDGYRRDEILVAFEGDVFRIVTNELETQPSPDIPPAPQPEPTLPPTSTWKGLRINWADQGGRKEYTLRPGQIMTWQFTTTDDPNYSGDVKIFEVVGTERVSRRLWISKTPGGAPVGRRASSEGVSLIKLGWKQGGGTFFRQALKTNTTYYLNVENVSGCSIHRGCGFYMSFGT